MLCPATLCAIVWSTPDFFWTYVAFAGLCAVLLALSLPAVRPLFLFASAALLFGLINISHWRGYIEPVTVRMYGLALTVMFLPFALLPSRLGLARGTLRLDGVGVAIVAAHIGLAFAFVGLTYATLGNVVLQQALRFDIPPSTEYVVKSTLPLAVLVPILFRRAAVQYMVLALTITPALLIGSRGSALIAILSFLLARTLVAPLAPTGTSSRRLRFAVFGLVSFAVILGGFYLRRSGDTQLAAASIVADAYFDYRGWWVYAVMPFHLGFREPAGLTNQIITTPLVNDVNPTTLFWADLMTMLPGTQAAAGQSLGQIIGTVDAGGLTPGLLGGLYLDFASVAVVVMFMLGAVLAGLALKGSRSVRYASLFLLAEMQVLHLFHRGFLKPEYLTSVLIVIFYLWIACDVEPEETRDESPARPVHVPS